MTLLARIPWWVVSALAVPMIAVGIYNYHSIADAERVGGTVDLYLIDRLIYEIGGAKTVLAVYLIAAVLVVVFGLFLRYLERRHTSLLDWLSRRVFGEASRR